jgi:tetratricopeptide (TPR) repeat protein
MLRNFITHTIGSTLLFVVASLAQQPAKPAPAPAPGSAADLAQQARKVSSQGKQDEALALYRQVLEKSPDSYEAHLGMGEVLDLNGDYAQARERLEKAIDLAPSDSKSQALRATAVSYAFDSNGAKAEEYEVQVFDARLRTDDFVSAGETCNELARIYLESGDASQAYKWYKTGYETALRKPDMSEAEKHLWLFRWESAQARVSARQGKPHEAKQHVAAAKAALDKANNPDQLRFYPYLTGYVAFYLKDYKTAIADLQKADQRDPLNLALLGESYEKSGETAKAKHYYRKVLESNVHNPSNAFARPLAKKKLAGG